MAQAGKSLTRGGANYKAIPPRIVDVCRGAEGAAALRSELRAPLGKWVAFDAYCVNTCDPLTLHVTSSVGDGLSPRDALRLFAIEAAATDFNPLADLAVETPGIAIMSRATLGVVQRSRRMREIFLPLGLCDELRAPLVAGQRCWGFLHLFRATGTFSDDDAARVAAVAPEIGRGLRRAMASRYMGETSKRAPALVIVGRDGSAQGVAGGASATIGMLDLDGHQPVPHGVYAVAQRARRAPDSAPAGTTRGPRGEWLALHGIAYRARLAAIVDQATPAQVAPLVLLAHGLTSRERHVAMLLLAGHSNAAIASVLGIGLFTVKDHVKHVFAKTRTRGRAELAAHAFATEG